MSCLISFFPSLALDFFSQFDSDLWLCVSWVFVPRRDPARPALAHAPWRTCPSPPCARAPSLWLSFPHSILQCTTPSLSPISLSRGALGFGDGDRRILVPRWALLPSPPLPSLSLPPPLSSSMRAPYSPIARPLRQRPATPASARAPLAVRPRQAAPRPHVPSPPRAASRIPARVTVVARCLAFGLFQF
jgi:hypothetical protein